MPTIDRMRLVWAVLFVVACGGGAGPGVDPNYDPYAEDPWASPARLCPEYPVESGQESYECCYPAQWGSEPEEMDCNAVVDDGEFARCDLLQDSIASSGDGDWNCIGLRTAEPVCRCLPN
jgi:hypothetical protein